MQYTPKHTEHTKNVPVISAKQFDEEHLRENSTVYLFYTLNKFLVMLLIPNSAWNIFIIVFYLTCRWRPSVM
jgi:hypothetical protein